MSDVCWTRGTLAQSVGENALARNSAGASCPGLDYAPNGMQNAGFLRRGWRIRETGGAILLGGLACGAKGVVVALVHVTFGGGNRIVGISLASLMQC